MRHAKQFLRLHTAHRRADAGHVVASLIEHEQIHTTLTRAKVAVRLTDRMITLAKAGTLAAHRKASILIGDGVALKKLFAEMGKRYQARKGGFTRLVRVMPRKGDGSPMAIVELIDRVPKPVTTEKAGAKEKAKKPAIAAAPASK